MHVPENHTICTCGAETDYIVYGRGKRNLLILPGAGDGFRTVRGLAFPFAMLYRRFADDFRVYVFSRRRTLPDGFSVLEMAKDVGTAMEELGAEPYDIIGVSQGGMIAQELALQYPDRIGKLVLVVTAAAPNAQMKEALGNWIAWAEAGDYGRILADSTERSYTGETLKKNMKQVRIMSRLSKPKDLSRFLILCQSCLGHDVRNRLDEIRCRTLILGGGMDRVVGPDASYELAAGICDSELYMYPEYSHGLYDQAADFQERVLTWLKSDADPKGCR